jgi:hypothetical protein
MESTLTVAFDPTEEPDFRGGLAIELTGLDDKNFILFKGRVDLNVRNASPSHHDDPVMQ